MCRSPDCRASGPASRRRSARLRARRGAPRRRARRLADLLMERLQHAGGFLAARHAQVQPLFLLGEDEIGIVLAIVAALAAILLRHRGHHAPAQRRPSGKVIRSASGSAWSCHGAAPSSAVTEFVLCTRHQRGALLGRERGDAGAVERHETGKEAVQPGALLVGENGAVSGTSDGIGGAMFWLIRPPPRRTSLLARRPRGAC